MTTLQNFLISQGYLANGSAVGVFGKLTQAAVQQFQKDQGIVTSGTPASTGYGAVGARTRERIVALSAAATQSSSTATGAGTNANTSSTLSITRTLASGMSGSDVTALQNFLIARGYLASGNASGFFGRLTEAAVQKFQKAYGIVSSGTPASTGYGVVGRMTRAKIADLSSQG